MKDEWAPILLAAAALGSAARILLYGSMPKFAQVCWLLVAAALALGPALRRHRRNKVKK